MAGKFLFEFSCFQLFIDHAQIIDIGEFSTFCLKAFASGATIDELAKVTLLNQDLIVEQLEFLKDRGYLTEDNKLTSKGEHIVKILEFKENYGKSVEFYVDNYIEDVNQKPIFPPEIIYVYKSEEGKVVQPKLRKTKLSRIINEFPSVKFVEFLKAYLKDYKDIIEKEKDKWSFHAVEKERCYVKIELSLDELCRAISFEYKPGLAIGVPVLISEPSLYVSSNVDSAIKTHLELLTKNENSIKKEIYNLLDGSKIDTDVQVVEHTSQFALCLKPKTSPKSFSLEKMIFLTFFILYAAFLNHKVIKDMDVFQNSKSSEPKEGYALPTLKRAYVTGIIDEVTLSNIFQSKLTLR